MKGNIKLKPSKKKIIIILDEQVDLTYLTLNRAI